MTEPRLKVIPSSEPEKWVDPRKRLIVIFNKRYEQTGKPNPLTFAACMVMLAKKFEIVDESTGELFVEYPADQAWQDEVEGFFRDEWARDKMNFHFAYLLKYFGRFGKPKEKKVSARLYWCSECFCNHKEGEHIK